MRIEEIINPGYGFRLLKMGEQAEESKAYYLTTTGWKVCPCSFSILETDVPCRVPIDVGDGWDLVPEGETVRDGDQIMHTYGDNYRTGEISGWYTVGDSVGRTVKQGMTVPNSINCKVLAFRRRKPEPVNTCVAAEEKRDCYWFCAGGLMTEKEARAAAIAFTKGDGSQSILLRAVSTFEKKTAVEIVETKICSPQS